MARTARPNEVFLNVPYDVAYEKQFIALVCAVVALGRSPACVLQLPDAGQGRLERLLEKLHSCSSSIHDLSRVGVPVRFNMPFELGMACAVAQGANRHQYFLFERRQYRLQKTLSDLNGRDPVIHRGRVRGTIRAVLEVLQRPDRELDVGEVFLLYQKVRRVINELLKRSDDRNVYSRPMFQKLVAAATQLATEQGLLQR